MTQKRYSSEEAVDFFDAKKLSVGIASVLATGTLMANNTANAHAETTSVSTSTAKSATANTSNVSTNSGIVVGTANATTATTTNTSTNATATAGQQQATATTQTAQTGQTASTTANGQNTQATAQNTNAKTINFAQEHKDLIDRAQKDGAKVVKDANTKEYNNQEDADKDVADQVKAIQKKLDEYESVKASYDKAKAAYDAAQAAYEKAASASDSNVVKDVTQALIFNQETGAALNVDAKNYIKASSWNDGDNNSVYTKSNITKSFGTSDLTQNKAEAVVKDKKATNGVTYTGVKMSTGETITATYTNLKNSTYVDPSGSTHKIAKVVYSIKLEKSTTNDGTANVFLSNDPNNTFWYSAKNENNGSVEFSITPTFYDEDGNKLSLTNGWFSMSSLNNGSTGTEYFDPANNNAKAIPGSSVTKHDDGTFYSDNDNSAEKAGFEWDSSDSAKRYYGAALLQLNGSEFKVGTKAKEGQDVYSQVSLDGNLATATQAVKPVDEPAKPTVTYHDVSVVTPQEPLNVVQKAKITYIDSTTGKVLKVDNIDGASNAKSGYQTYLNIQNYQNKGYVLDSDSTNGQEIVFDDDASKDQEFVVKLSHRVDHDKETQKVTRTIKLHEPTGTKTVKQVATVERDVTTDAVTGKKTYGDWSDGSWDKYTSPKVKGYTASKDTVGKKSVDGDTKNKTVDIYYKKKSASASQKNGGKSTGGSSTTSTTTAAGNGGSGAAGTTASGSGTTAATLPQTGNESSIALQASGMFATGASLLATVVARKKKMID